MSDKPKRRWFQFGIGTLLVIVTLAAIVGYYLNWIHQRHVFLSKHFPVWPSVDRRASPPWPLSLFGETGYECIYLDASVDDLQRETDVAHNLFPEAGDVQLSEPTATNNPSHASPF